VVGVALATVVATAAVVGVALGAAAAWARRGLAVVGVGAGRVVFVAGAVVVVTVVGGSTDVVVSSTAVVDVEDTATLLDRRIAGSLLPWGTPAMATPTAAHITSISAVIKRCPGLTAWPSRGVTLCPRLAHLADPGV
jgi:hypothetical protein